MSRATEQQRGQQRQRGGERAQRRHQLPQRNDVAQQKDRHDGRGDQVDDPGGRRAADHPQVRQQGERPDQPADQRAQVVGRVEVGQRAAGVGRWVFCGRTAALQQRHQQRHLGADQPADQGRAHRQHPRRPVRPVQEREHRVERRGGQATDDAQQRLDGDERDGRAGQQRFDRQGTRAQRGDVARDDQGGGDDAAAVQARRQRQQRQFVDDAAGRARRDGGQQQCPPPPRRLRGPNRLVCGRHDTAAAVTPPTARSIRATANDAGCSSGSSTCSWKLPGMTRCIVNSATPSRITPINPYTATPTSP